MDLEWDGCTPLGLLSWHQAALKPPVSWDKLLVTLSTLRGHSHLSHTTSWLSIKILLSHRERERETEKVAQSDSKKHWMEYGMEIEKERERESSSQNRKIYSARHLAIKQLRPDLRERETERLL